MLKIKNEIECLFLDLDYDACPKGVLGKTNPKYKKKEPKPKVDGKKEEKKEEKNTEKRILFSNNFFEDHMITFDKPSHYESIDTVRGRILATAFTDEDF